LNSAEKDNNIFSFTPGPGNDIRLPAGWASWREIFTPLLQSAARSGKHGEIPVSAAIFDVKSGEILGKGLNSSIQARDPAGHAEINALRRAAAARDNHRLPGTVLAVTLEPCIMCLGAMVQARIDGLVFAAFDPKAGAIVSCLDYPGMDWLNSRFWVLGGILQKQSAALLQSFFRRRRNAER
jgi:tRNA(adenine34) deaminase